ncbi:c-type cytochrome [Azonexus hydrophilus]|uniref:c-type cytochrome n=1 Tax=Azonexus hydrophilus TaxID=418702 RepID=UPI001965611B|nr:c-type cytochrome [Azonexus hydrophilus]
MKIRTIPLTLALLASSAGLAQASGLPQTPPPYFAANCANCHGTDGKSTAAIPGIAGKDKDWLEEVLKAYKQGTRPATIMHQLAKGYTDEEIAILADYFSRQK